MPKIVTIMTGIVVQKISRPVCPWIGTPSRMSSGPRRRNFQSAYPMTTMTRPKIAPETYVIASIRWSVRVACTEARVGIQGNWMSAKLRISPSTTPRTTSLVTLWFTNRTGVGTSSWIGASAPPGARPPTAS